MLEFSKGVVLSRDELAHIIHVVRPGCFRYLPFCTFSHFYIDSHNMIVSYDVARTQESQTTPAFKRERPAAFR